MAEPSRLDRTVALALRTWLAAAAIPEILALLELIRAALLARNVHLEYRTEDLPADPRPPTG